MIDVFYCCDIEANWVASMSAADELRHAEEERRRDAELELCLNPCEPCDGDDREYVDVAVARELRLL